MSRAIRISLLLELETVTDAENPSRVHNSTPITELSPGTFSDILKRLLAISEPPAAEYNTERKPVGGVYPIWLIKVTPEFPNGRLECEWGDM